MISKFLKVSVIILALGLFTSCSSDDDTPAEAPLVKLRANVNGVNFSTDNATAVLSNDGKQLIIEGNTASDVLRLTIGGPADNLDPVAEQSYILDGSSIATITYTTSGVSYFNRVDIDGGIINLNSFDMSNNTIFGSFNVTLSTNADQDNIIELTNGSINNLLYTVE